MLTEQIIELIERICIFGVIAFFGMRLKILIYALDNIHKHKVLLAILFGTIGILATHFGIVVSLNEHRYIDWGLLEFPFHLEAKQAVISLRDTVVISSGLIGGVWIGLGTGLIVGLERWFLGGMVGNAAGIATIILGIFSGLAHEFPPKWKWWSPNREIIIIAFICSVIQRLIIILIPSDPDKWELSWLIATPVTLANIVGCFIFVNIHRGQDHKRIKEMFRDAELLAYQSRIHPHFLGNTLGAIKGLIITDPYKAGDYLADLATFYKNTLKNSYGGLIPLNEELDQVDFYIKFRDIRLKEPIIYSKELTINPKNYMVPTCCLLTLVENCFDHGFEGRPFPYNISVSVMEDKDILLISVIDNGHGIPDNVLKKIGKSKITSSEGNGIAIFQLNSSLESSFQRRAKLSFKSSLGVGTEANLVIPKLEAKCQTDVLL